jgi:ABC-type enterochelin transport system ATPase subunit
LYQEQDRRRQPTRISPLLVTGDIGSNNKTPHLISIVKLQRLDRASIDLRRGGVPVAADVPKHHLAVRFADRIVVLHRGAKVADDIPANTVTDDLIRTVFEIDVRVQRHSDGTPLMVPQLMSAIEPGLQGMS